jgi:hypothetical protein
VRFEIRRGSTVIVRQALWVEEVARQAAKSYTGQFLQRVLSA